MMNRYEMKANNGQKKGWRRFLALLSALMLLISSVGITAFAEAPDEDIYSDPVTAPIPKPAADETPAPKTSEKPAEEETEKPLPEEETAKPAEEETEKPSEEETEKPSEEVTDEPSEEETEEPTEEITEEPAEEEETPEPTPEIIYNPGTLTGEADGVTVRLDYTAEACIPDDATLVFSQASGVEYYSAMKTVSRLVRQEESADGIWTRVLKEDGNTFYTVILVDSEGNVIHPAAAMTLTVENLTAGEEYYITGDNARELTVENGILTIPEYGLESFGYVSFVLQQTGNITLEHIDRDYQVIATYGPDAGFPAGTTLKVREILPGTAEYQLYSGMTDEALNEDWAEITLERYFDITFVVDGEEREPQSFVDVQIIFRDKIEQNEETEVQAVHIENNEANVIEAETDSNKAAKHDAEAIDTVAFTSDSFSVYGVVQKKKITQKVLAADGNTYEINVTYTAEAAIPEGSTLKVEEIPEGSDLWEAYRKQTAAALGADDVRLPGLYDITIIDAEGNPVEPGVPVNVSIKLANAETEEDLHVVHFTEDIPQELVEAAAEEKKEEQTEVQSLTEEEMIAHETITDKTVEGDTVTFATAGFSVYAFAYTVDFYYGEYEYHLDGGAFMSLKNLLKILHVVEEDRVQEFVNNISGISFTDLSLLSISKVEEDTTVGAIKARLNLDCEWSASMSEADMLMIDSTEVHAVDWAIISLKPFLSEENMRITMTNGDTYDIKVLDAQYAFHIRVNDLAGVYIGGGDNALAYAQNKRYNNSGAVISFDSSAGSKVANVFASTYGNYRFVDWIDQNGYSVPFKRYTSKNQYTIESGTLDSISGELYATAFVVPQDQYLIWFRASDISNGFVKIKSGNNFRNVWDGQSVVGNAPKYLYSGSDTNTIIYAEPKYQYGNYTLTFMGWFDGFNGNCISTSNEYKISDATKDTLMIPLYSNGDYYNVWFDGTNGVSGGNFTPYTRVYSNGGHTGSWQEHAYVSKNAPYNTVTLPTASQVDAPLSQGKTHFVLHGWYNITETDPSKQRYFEPGASVTIDKDTVFYADWFPDSYNYGSGGIATADTSSFISTTLYDYNDLFNIESLNISSTIDAAGHTDMWSRNTTTRDFLFITAQARVGSIMNPTGRDQDPLKNQSFNNPSQRVSGVYNNSLINALFGNGTTVGKRVVGSAGNIYILDENSGYYYFDSHRNAASYGSGKLNLYNYTVKTSAGGSSDDFLPFNYQNGSTTFTEKDGEVNYWFGMKSNIHFYLPNAAGEMENGQTGNRSIKGDEMVYRFSGDDDVWVCVDGASLTPLLDLGGIHGKVYGEINFSTGEVTYINNPTITYVNGVMTATGEATVITFTLPEGEHDLTFYYLERGSSQSNCAVYFNLATKHKLTNVTIDKKWYLRGQDGSITETTAAPSKTFQLYATTEDLGSNGTDTRTEVEITKNGGTHAYTLNVVGGPVYPGDQLKLTASSDLTYSWSIDWWHKDQGYKNNNDRLQETAYWNASTSTLTVPDEATAIYVGQWSTDKPNSVITLTKVGGNSSAELVSDGTFTHDEITALLSNARSIGDPITLAPNETYTFRKLHEEDEQGRKLSYFVLETDWENNLYEVEYTTEGSGDNAVTTANWTVSNYIDESRTIDIPVRKAWNNADGTNSNTWPAGVTVTVQLLADGTPVQGQTLTLTNLDTQYFRNLPADNNGTPIAYTVEETAIDGTNNVYSTLITGDQTNGYVITNTPGERAKVKVVKEWYMYPVNGGAAVRQTSGSPVTMHLYRTTDDIQMITSHSGDNNIERNGNGVFALTGVSRIEPGDTVRITVSSRKPVWIGIDYTGSNGYNRDAAFGSIAIETSGTSILEREVPAGLSKIHIGHWTDGIEEGDVTVNVEIVNTPSGYTTGLNAVDTFTLSSDNNWTYVNDDLDLKDGNDNYYHYFAVEEPAGEWTQYVHSSEDVGNSQTRDVWTVKNYTTEKQANKLNVIKHWTDAEGNDITSTQTTIDSITYDLYQQYGVNSSGELQFEDCSIDVSRLQYGREDWNSVYNFNSDKLLVNTLNGKVHKGSTILITISSLYDRYSSSLEGINISGGRIEKDEFTPIDNSSVKREITFQVTGNIVISGLLIIHPNPNNEDNHPIITVNVITDVVGTSTPSTGTTTNTSSKVATIVLTKNTDPTITLESDFASSGITVERGTGDWTSVINNLPAMVGSAEAKYYVVEHEVSGTDGTPVYNPTTPISPDGSSISITNTLQRITGSVRVTKAFVGLTSNEYPASFQITNDVNGTVFGLNTEDGKVAPFGGSGTVDDPYYWEIDNLDLYTPVTFTESGYTVDGYNVLINGYSIAGTVTANASTTPEPVGFVNSYDRCSVVLTGYKTLEGRALAEGEFSFVVEENEEEVATGVSRAAASGVPAQIIFEPISYTQEGTYTYTIREVIPAEDTSSSGDNGEETEPVLSYDDHTFTATVVVEEIDHKLTVTNVTYDPEVVSFINTYHARGELVLEGNKSYIAGETLQDGQFTFTVKTTVNEDDTDVEKTVATGVVKADGSIEFTPISYTEADAGQTYTYSISEDMPDEATEDNNFTVDGIRYDPTVRTVTVSVEDDGEGHMIPTILPESDEIAYTNGEFVNISAVKQWDGITADQQPNAIQFTLYARVDGEAETEVYEDSVRIILKDEGTVNKDIITWSGSAEWNNLPKYDENRKLITYSIKETGVFFGLIPDDVSTIIWVTQEMYYITGEGAVVFPAGSNDASITINNAPKKINVPVEKDWDDFETESRYDWSATFRLKSAIRYFGQSAISEYEYVLDANDQYQDITITKGMMAGLAGSLASRSFTDLPMYGYDQENGWYQILYSVDEVAYTVTDNGNVIFAYDGVNYTAANGNSWYEINVDQAAGISGTSEQEYVIRVSNIPSGTYSPLIVKKQWHDIEDPDNYPEIRFALYQGTVASKLVWDNTVQANVWKDVIESGSVYTANGITFENIPLNKNNKWTWKCPVELPADNGQGTRYGYYVVENTTDGHNKRQAALYQNSVIGANGMITTAGAEITSNADYGVVRIWDYYNSQNTNHAYRMDEEQPKGQDGGIMTNSGILTIVNRAPKYKQLDIKKKIMEYINDSLYTTTSDNFRTINFVLEIQLYRRIYPINEKTDFLVDWETYGVPFMVGYDSTGKGIEINENDFELTPNLSGWHWTIHDNRQENGLPAYGYYQQDDGTYIPVRYRYIPFEIGAYANTNRDPYFNGLDYEWMIGLQPAAWDGDGGQYETFPRIQEGQDQDRLMNIQATDLLVEKEWDHVPSNVEEVYLKIYRQINGRTNVEDFTNDISRRTNAFSFYGIVSDSTRLQMINDGVLVLGLTPTNASVLIHGVPLSPVFDSGSDLHSNYYHYWVEEIGYKDSDGNIYLNNGSNSVTDAFFPQYDQSDTSTGNYKNSWNTNPQAEKLKLSTKGKNKLRVKNTSTKDIDVQKVWKDKDGTTLTGPWNNPDTNTPITSSIRFKIKRTDGLNETYLTFGGNQYLTIGTNGQRAVVKAETNGGTAYTVTYVQDSSDEDDIGNWKIKVHGLQKYSPTDTEYQYTIEELTDAEGRPLNQENTGIEHCASVTTADGDHFTITNEQIVNSLAIRKVFSGNAADEVTDAMKGQIQFHVTGPNGFDHTFTYGVNNTVYSATWNGDTLLIKNIDAGTYTVKELHHSPAELFGTSSDGATYLHTWTYTIDTSVTNGTADEQGVDAEVETNGVTLVIIENTYEKAELVITKSILITAVDGNQVTSLPEGEDITFTITPATGLTKNSFSYNNDFEDGELKLTQADGILPNTEYTVTETNADLDGYTRTTTITVNNGTPAEYSQESSAELAGTGTTNIDNYKAIIAFVNTYEEIPSGSLKILKTLTLRDGVQLDPPPTFYFTVQDTDGNYYDSNGEPAGTTEPTTTENGLIAVAPGTTGVILEDLPIGDYTVTEVNIEQVTIPGYTRSITTVYGQNEMSATVTVPANSTVEVEAVNTYTRDLGNLTINKVLSLSDGAVLNPPPTFNFTVTDGTYYYSMNEETLVSSATEVLISVTPGTPVTLTGLPTGNYTVTEHNPVAIEGYEYTGTTLTGGEAVDGNDLARMVSVTKDATVSVEATNSYTKGSIVVTKVFEGLPTGTSYPQGFKITAVVTRNDETIWTVELVPSEAAGSGTADDPYKWMISDLPIGATVTLTETDYSMDGYVWSGEVKVNGVAVTDGNGTEAAVEINNTEEKSAAFKNNYMAGAELPATGGSGTLIYTITGLALVTLAGVIFLARRKRNHI